MVVQIGKDKKIYIKNDILNKMFSSIGMYHYETGGILGTNVKGVITTFCFDKIQNPILHEYYPNTEYLNDIINKEWRKINVKFIGFVHSHLNNDKISEQDVIYSREILKYNRYLQNILIAIINLSNKQNNIKWYCVSKDTVIMVN